MCSVHAHTNFTLCNAQLITTHQSQIVSSPTTCLVAIQKTATIVTLRCCEELQDRTVELTRLEFHAVGGAGQTTPHFMKAASSTCSSSSSEERLWRECLKNCFGGSAARKAAQLHDDITCLSHGLKPALLLDYIRPDSTALQLFLRTLRRHNVALPELTILVVNEDIFLIHLPTLTTPLARFI